MCPPLFSCSLSVPARSLVAFSAATGRLASITHKGVNRTLAVQASGERDRGDTIPTCMFRLFFHGLGITLGHGRVQEDLLWYDGQTIGQASGAYIFHPASNTPTPVQVST